MAGVASFFRKLYLRHSKTPISNTRQQLIFIYNAHTHTYRHIYRRTYAQTPVARGIPAIWNQDGNGSFESFSTRIR